MALWEGVDTVRRGVRSAVARTQGRMLGWQGAHVPSGSQIIGRKRIRVGVDFDSRGPVWLEAVTNYAGDEFASSITIGARFRSSGGIHVGAVQSVAIGDDCLTGRNVAIVDHDHGDYRGVVGMLRAMPAPVDRSLRARGRIIVGDRVWIGDNAIILGGVTIGDDAVIGAGAVVTRDVPPGGIAVGAPARTVRTYLG
ncbi:acyltransferase [Microbacterium sp. RG1]|uniref:acyltransferase n=1 Tax=Microbacterium sp. RG1 TaxID=2489212 RepID=UPI0010CA452A|nr:acyltransferase [Microbacterium sp. RG1]QCQ17046.1 acyltransferase [Microbacterium sp. RG1]